MPSHRRRASSLQRFAVGAFWLALLSITPERAGADEPWIDTSDRGAVVAAHRRTFDAEVPPLVWSGDHDRCEPGTSSAEYRRASINRVNYYRSMAGVVAAVTEDVSYSDKAQDAAMMMSVQRELTHSPSTSFACFTEVGQQAAANSNLYLGRSGPLAIDGYIEDPGDNNTDVGHRTTILHPPTRHMGVGDVAGDDGGPEANALWVFDDRVFAETSGESRTPMREADRFVAWPPRGYVPADLVHPRWSFTRAGLDLSDASVAILQPSAPPGRRWVPLDVVNRSGSAGHVPLPTIVWEPAVDPAPAVDTDYVVIITGARPEGGGDAGAVTVGATTPVPVVGGERTRSVYVYTVRVLGRYKGDQLTIAQTLDEVAWAQD